MTLAVAAWCSNGIAISADSRTSYYDSKSNTLRIATDATEKLFTVGRVAVATAGWNRLSNETIFSHMQEFSKTYNDEPPSKVSQDLSLYFRDRYQEHIKAYPQSRSQPNSNVIAFLVVGYENDEPVAYRAVVYDQNPGDTMQLQEEYGPVTIADGVGHFRVGKSSLTWIGDSEIVECLVLGYNKTVLGGIGVPTQIFSAANKIIPTPGFALQDCIDLIYFLTQASERMKHFSAGNASAVFANRTVGGPIDVAVVRRRSGVTIIKKKELVAQSQIEAPPQLTDEDEANSS